MVCLSGEDSVLAPLLEMCPGGEIDSHLEGSEREFSKLPYWPYEQSVQTSMEEVIITLPVSATGYLSSGCLQA